MSAPLTAGETKMAGSNAELSRRPPPSHITQRSAAQRERLALPRLLSIQETCRQLGGTARSRVYVLIGDGNLKTVKLGRRRFVTTESIDRLIDKLARRSAL